MNRTWSGAILFLSVLVLTAGVVQAQALIGYWKFDGNLSDSAGKNNGTFTGGQPTYVEGQVGQALSFDGVDDFVNIPSPVNPAIYSIAVWVKPARPDAAGVVTRTSANGPLNEWSHQLRIQNGVFHHYLWVGAERNVPGTTTVVADTWYHVVIVARNNGPMRLYVNGKEDAASISTAGTLWAAGDRLHIGSNSGHGMGWFQGLVDDLRIYNRELSAAQIADLYNGIPPAFVKAENPNPADGATGVGMPFFQWTPGEGAVFHDVYVGPSPDLTAADLVGPRQTLTMFFYGGGLQPGTKYWWRVDEIDAANVTHTGDVWSFTTTPLTAFEPSPRNGDKWIALDATLTWQPGQGAMSHEVYFSTDQDAVANRAAAAAKPRQFGATYAPAGLAEKTTYYWAVDEIASGDQKYAGPLWSFTTTGPGGGVKGEYFNGTTPMGEPALTRLDPSIDFNWGDPGGPGTPIGTDQFSVRWTADLEIAVADTYTFITNTDDGARLWLNDEQIIEQWWDQAPTDAVSAPVALEPGVYPLRMEYYENLGGAVAHLFWQTPTVAREIIPAGPLQPPVRARVIYPMNGDANIPQETTLTWSAGDAAVAHDVYFGVDAQAVAGAIPADKDVYAGRQPLEATTFDPGLLEWGKTYWWRVDEVNEASADSPWKGPVWSFTTANFIVVDDMERYTDEEGTDSRIYETWIDGYVDGSSGSIVGNINPPFAERTIVHSGRQSMPMDYNNIDLPYYSEAYREFSPLQNWTVNGVTDLVLWVRGWPAQPAVNETAPGMFTVSGSGADIWANADQFTFVYKTLNGDGAISARVVSNGTGSNAWAKGGVMIRDSLAAGSVHAHMDLTGGAGGGNGASFQYRLATDDISGNADAATAVTPPYWVKVERKGDTFTGFVSADGAAWTPQGDPQYIPMSAPAYIGLCVTSHAPTEYRTFDFDNVKVTGATGSWQAAEIGFLRNTPARLYVTIEDNAGKMAVVDHATVVNATEWTEWKIPLSDLKGVNLAKVKRMYLSVGAQAFAEPGGTGRIYIDDIRVTRP
jgi:hypothetical protein